MKTVYSDYPITELGDTPNQHAPIREFLLRSYDGDKYCKVQEVSSGVVTEIKSGYLYMDWDIYDESNIVPCEWIKEVEDVAYYEDVEADDL
jgi:hypothetical protein